MNSALAARARRMRSPSCREVLPSGGSCSFFFTSADCAPAVERPSSQRSASRMRRKSATSLLSKTSGMPISMLESPELSKVKGQAQIDLPARGDFDEGLRALVQRVVVELVRKVLTIDLQARVSLDPELSEGVEAPI